MLPVFIKSNKVNKYSRHFTTTKQYHVPSSQDSYSHLKILPSISMTDMSYVTLNPWL